MNKKIILSVLLTITLAIGNIGIFAETAKVGDVAVGNNTNAAQSGVSTQNENNTQTENIAEITNNSQSVNTTQYANGKQPIDGTQNENITQFANSSLSENLFINGDFEDTSVQRPVPDESSYSTEDVHSGTHSLKLNTRWSYAGLYDTTTHLPFLEANKSYYYSIWLKPSAAVTTTSIFHIFFELYDENDVKTTDYLALESSTLPAGTGYTNFSGYYTMPASVSKAKKTNLVIVSQNEGVTYFVDDIEIREFYGSKPEITDISMVDGMGNVATNFSMTLKFKNPIDSATVNQDTVIVGNDKKYFSKAVDIKGDSSEFIVEFEGLEPYTNYEFAINGIKSANGGTVDPVTLHFTTDNGDINYVDNGEFENVSKPLPTGAKSYNSEFVHSGKYSAYVPGVEWGYGGLDNIKAPNLMDGESYSYSFWVRLTPEALGGKTFAFLTCFYYEGSENKMQSELSETTITAADGFVNVQGEFNVPKGKLDPKKPPLVLVVPRDAKTPYYADDIVIKHLPKKIEALKTGEIYENATINLKNDFYTIRTNSDITAKSLEIGNVTLENSDITVTDFQLVNPRKMHIKFSKMLNYNTNYKLKFNGIKNDTNSFLESIAFNTVAKCNVLDLKFIANYGEANAKDITATGLEAGKISTVIAYNSAENKVGTANLVTMLYKNGIMEKIILTPVASADLITSTIDVPDVSDGDYYIKAYIIDNFTTMQPQSAYNIKLSELQK